MRFWMDKPFKGGCGGKKLNRVGGLKGHGFPGSKDTFKTFRNNRQF